MKLPTYAILAAALACGLASAQTTAYTTPVGYTTTTVSAAFGAGNPKNNVVAPNLQNPASWAGTVASISGNTLTLTGTVTSPLTSGAYNQLGFSFTAYGYYIQANDGFWTHIVSNNGTSVTLRAGEGSKFTVGEAVTIRRHLTISDYFGANNSANLLASPAGDTAIADNITLIDEVNGGTVTVIASDALGGTWITDGFEDAATLPIYPEQGLQVLRRGLTDLSFVATGEVDLKPRQIGVDPGVQIRPYVTPVNTTLTALNLYTGNPATGVVGSATGDIGEADIVTVLVNGVPLNYFYCTVDLGVGAGWYDDSLSFVGDVALPAGAGLIINRSNPTNSQSFVWVKPALGL